MAAAGVDDDRLLLRRRSDVEVDVVVAETCVAVDWQDVLLEMRVGLQAQQGQRGNKEQAFERHCSPSHIIKPGMMGNYQSTATYASVNYHNPLS